MQRVYGRLASAGIDRKFVRDFVLPDWWEDEVAETPTGFAQGALIISKHLGVDVESLRDSTGPLRFRPVSSRFKKRSNLSESEVCTASALASRVAGLVAAAISGPIPQGFDIASARREILAAGSSWVDLESLAKHCWDCGIPVVYLAHLPKGVKKMDGMVANVGGRPVILIAKNSARAAWLLFILAHELGHIARGHIAADSILVDEKIERGVVDIEETEANEAAVELLTGDTETRFITTGRWPSAEKLVVAAKLTAAEHGVDPGHVVLNYAHSMGTTFWGVANAALKSIEPHDARESLKSLLDARVDWSMLPTDSSVFLSRITGSASDVASDGQ